MPHTPRVTDLATVDFGTLRRYRGFVETGTRGLVRFRSRRFGDTVRLGRCAWWPVGRKQGSVVGEKWGTPPQFPQLTFPLRPTPQHATTRWGLSSLEPLHRHSAYLGRLLPQAGVSPAWSRMLKTAPTTGSQDPGELRFHSWSKPKPLRPPQLQDHAAQIPVTLSRLPTQCSTISASTTKTAKNLNLAAKPSTRSRPARARSTFVCCNTLTSLTLTTQV